MKTEAVQLPFVDTLLSRIAETSPLIQVVLGPRQVGKTTGIMQLVDQSPFPCVYGSADKTLATGANWIRELWHKGMGQCDENNNVVIIADEIQKIENWSETVKVLWDQRTRSRNIRLIVLGSSSLKLQKGLSESLTGRFELIRVPHWNYLEMKSAFSYDLHTYLQYGGYPGSAPFINDWVRWYTYIKESIVETVIGKDILDTVLVERPALFRQAFEIFCSYPARSISYTKLLGQLQDRGNTDLVKRYIELFNGAFLLSTLQKYSAKVLKVKSSSPKLLPMCPCLATLQLGEDAVQDSETRGRLFEAAVGADLLRLPGSLYYWRQGNHEVDYIYVEGKEVYAIEVKSGRKKPTIALEKFRYQFGQAKTVIISPDNYEQFLKQPQSYLKTFSLR